MLCSLENRPPTVKIPFVYSPTYMYFLFSYLGMAIAIKLLVTVRLKIVLLAKERSHYCLATINQLAWEPLWKERLNHYMENAYQLATRR